MAQVDTPTTVQDEATYYTKEGRTLIGSSAPTAYAWSYPWPPCPTNLCKNRVFRPKDEESKEVANEAAEEFSKEAKPLGLDLLEIDGNPLNRTMIPEIELALYWERHPYEFRPLNLNRAKSAANLSSLTELIQADNDEDPTIISRRASSESANSVNKISRSSSASVATRKTGSRKNSDSESMKNETTNANNQVNPDRSDGNQNYKSAHSQQTKNSKGFKKPLSISNHQIPKILQVLNQNEKRKFEEIKPRQSNDNNNYSKAVRDTNSIAPNSIGVQVTFDDVTDAALKSTYLCPLHGSYRQGVDRRAKSGFRTDMSSFANPHSRCSRSRTKLVKSTESQTDNGSENSNMRNNNDPIDPKTNKTRSKTAGGNQKRKGSGNNMLSEYHGNYRHPGHIAASENRRLRNKILSYCFTKHSIF